MTCRIITAADHRFRGILAEWERHVRGTGYTYTIFDLDQVPGNHGLERESKDILPCLFKPRVLRMARHSEDFIIWLDADALLRARIDEVFTSEYDIAATRRSEAQIKKKGAIPSIGHYNAGVIVFRNNENLPGFLEEWEIRTLACGVEQQAFNELVMATGARIRNLPMSVYNDDRFQRTSKIWHYKNARKAELDPSFAYRSPA